MSSIVPLLSPLYLSFTEKKSLQLTASLHVPIRLMRLRDFHQKVLMKLLLVFLDYDGSKVFNGSNFL